MINPVIPQINQSFCVFLHDTWTVKHNIKKIIGWCGNLKLHLQSLTNRLCSEMNIFL